MAFRSCSWPKQTTSAVVGLQPSRRFFASQAHFQTLYRRLCSWKSLFAQFKSKIPTWGERGSCWIHRVRTLSNRLNSWSHSRVEFLQSGAGLETEVAIRDQEIGMILLIVWSFKAGTASQKIVPILRIAGFEVQMAKLGSFVTQLCEVLFFQN